MRIDMWVILQNNADWDCFKTLNLAGDLEDSKSTSGGTLCIFGTYTFVPVSWMCKKQTSVSHSSTESEIISLDAGLRLDGIPALDLCDLIVAVLGNTNQNHTEQGDLLKNKREVCSPPHTIYNRKQSQRVINDLDNVDVIPSNVQSSHQEALLYVFEDNEAVIKMILKGRSPTMRHVSRTHGVALDWLFDRSNLEPKIQIKHIDTKNQLADILTKGNFTRDEWNRLLCLFDISHFSSTDGSELMSKRTQKESGEERVTAKSKPMMNLVSRCSATFYCIRKARGKTRHESQFPLSSRTEQQHRTGRPVKDACSSKTWSSPKWKSDELMEDRTGRPVVFAQHTDKFIVENDKMDSYTGAKSEMSLESRSFLNKMNDQVRKRQNQSSKDATKDSDKHSVIWGMFMSSTLQASVFMEKNYSDNLHSIKNAEDITMKQMFDISEKLITKQSDEIYGVNTIHWEDSSWKYLSLVGDEEVISLLHTKVYVFSDSVLCLGKMNENPQSYFAWEDRLTWFKSSPEYRTLDRIDGEPMEFEWNIFPRFTSLQLVREV